MAPFNIRLKKLFDKIFGQYTSSVTFESIWNVHQSNPKRVFGRKKLVLVLGITLVLIFSLLTAGYAGYSISKNIDKTDYSFIDDQQLIGKWQAVDFVQEPGLFNPDKQSWNGELYLSELVFIENGKMLSSIENGNLAYTTFSWTKDHILSIQDGTSSEYEIKEINDETYLLFQWKSGDYVFRNMTPWYYVLKKADSKDYSNYQVTQVKVDKIDYPFEDDLKMKGTWESVDFVRTKDYFKPGEKNWFDDLFLVGFKLENNGEITFSTTSGQFSNNGVTWTKGLILNKLNFTASQCSIKELNGSTYMFFEWKSGDYTLRGKDPCYYVLKKVE